jgi:branched-subunit amino acid transport protein
MIVWLTIFAAGALTYITRLSFIALFGQRAVPDRLKRALRFVPPAVLSAIIFPQLFLEEGSLYLSPDNFRLISGLVAGFVAWRTKSMAATIIAGMTVLMLLLVFVG